MTREEVRLKLQEVFEQVFVEDVVVNDELTAQNVDEWDSLSHISLIVAIEKAFGIRFTIGEVESTRNVGELIGLIIRHKKAASES